MEGDKVNMLLRLAFATQVDINQKTVRNRYMIKKPAGVCNLMQVIAEVANLYSLVATAGIL